MSILDKIIAQKKTETAALDVQALRRAADSAPTPRDFLAELKRRRIGPNPSLISELKRASPRRGFSLSTLTYFRWRTSTL